MNDITAYFSAERAESVLFIAVGALAMAFAAWAWLKPSTAFFKGMAVPLAAVAMIQLVVGTTVYLRTPQDIERVQQAIGRDPGAIARVEIPRMQKVAANFVAYRWLELALLSIGVLMAALARGRPSLRGAGIGLALQSALMLGLDAFAEARAEAYLRFLTTV